ncbi:MAG: PD-(D/E)XK nuclease family protein [Wenzhouxiangellaceae bacterium]|nr:PD-(D/E)XK nuclease family protein [Wenzhouxiangellaceae bacterium]
MSKQQSPQTKTILTPTARLARVEKRRLADARVTEGAQAWRAPEVLSFSAWLGSLRGQALMTGAVDRVPVSASQSRLLWQQVIDTDVFIGEPRVYTLAERAWRTIHEHCLAHPSEWPEALLSEDSRRFRDWVQRFEKVSGQRGVIDEWSFAARLPGLFADGALEWPAMIELIGFELPPTPLQQQIFKALADAGTAINGLAIDKAAGTQTADGDDNRNDNRNDGGDFDSDYGIDSKPDSGNRSRHPSADDHVLDAQGFELHRFTDADEELRAAAAWARARVAHCPDQAVAVVVPDLNGRLARVERIFLQLFDPPGFALGDTGAEAWHVSLGLPLAQWSLIADALLLLRLDPARIDQATAGRILASACLGGSSHEAGRRARATADLMQWSPFEITAFELIGACRKSGATIIAAQLDAWKARRPEHRDAAWPSEWVARFQTELELLGFGRGRALDSREYQVLQRWHELLEQFGALDAVITTPIKRGFALSLLAERAGGATFRERNPGCPVEILGVEEALGSRFDALWITTLDTENWPGSVRREPLIPGPVQARVPGASSDGRLARAGLELAGLLRAANDVCGSWSSGSEDPQREPTQLLYRPQIIDAPAAPAREPIALERIDDDRHAPMLLDAKVRGGTGVLSDQSACPFRAFALRRLGARELAMPRPGLDAAARGNLTHTALELFWQGLAGHAELIALKPDELDQRIHTATDQALGRLTEPHRLLLSAAGRRLEQRCSVRTLQRWLELERSRGDFRVAAREQEIAMEFAGLKLKGKIDRIDETPAGTVLIDYKTGRAGRNGWMPDARIADPQLPAYALAMTSRPAALAFARIRPDELKFDGLCETDAGIPGVTELAEARGAWKDAEDWNVLLNDWQTCLDGLSISFQEGRAEVDPRDAQACRNCHLHSLCRIHERMPAADTEHEA